MCLTLTVKEFLFPQKLKGGGKINLSDNNNRNAFNFLRFHNEE